MAIVCVLAKLLGNIRHIMRWCDPCAHDSCMRWCDPCTHTVHVQLCILTRVAASHVPYASYGAQYAAPYMACYAALAQAGRRREGRPCLTCPRELGLAALFHLIQVPEHCAETILEAVVVPSYHLGLCLAGQAGDRGSRAGGSPGQQGRGRIYGKH